jgi:hypothetical protein
LGETPTEKPADMRPLPRVLTNETNSARWPDRFTATSITHLQELPFEDRFWTETD